MNQWTKFWNMWFNQTKEPYEKDPRIDIDSSLEKRIRWVRKQLDNNPTKEHSVNYQWLLNHLITIQEGKEMYNFTLDPRDKM